MAERRSRAEIRLDNMASPSQKQGGGDHQQPDIEYNGQPIVQLGIVFLIQRPSMSAELVEGTGSPAAPGNWN